MNEVLGALGIINLDTAPQTRIITPYQNGTLAFTTFLKTCHTRLRSMVYAATLPAYFDQLIVLHKSGIDLRVIFDLSQSMGVVESPHIKALKTAGLVQGKDFLIGTSSQAHQIMHMKATVIDSLYVEDGSWNYTVSADSQINDQCYTTSLVLAAFYEDAFSKLWSWITANEVQI